MQKERERGECLLLCVMFNAITPLFHYFHSTPLFFFSHIWKQVAMQCVVQKVECRREWGMAKQADNWPAYAQIYSPPRQSNKQPQLSDCFSALCTQWSLIGFPMHVAGAVIPKTFTQYFNPKSTSKSLFISFHLKSSSDKTKDYSTFPHSIQFKHMHEFSQLYNFIKSVLLIVFNLPVSVRRKHFQT